MDATGPAFPFTIDDLGRVATQTGDANIRARIIQLLLTSPGERVHLPEFGCGLVIPRSVNVQVAMIDALGGRFASTAVGTFR